MSVSQTNASMPIADAEHEPAQRVRRELSAQRCERVLDPADPHPAMHGQRQGRGRVGFQREARDGTLLGLEGEDPAHVVVDDRGEARHRVGRRVGVEQRHLVDVRIGRHEQGARGGESAAVSIVRAEGEGEHLRFLGGGLLTMKATAAETGGSFLLFEDLMPAGTSTPLHTHNGEDEALYVLDGELLVHIDGADHPVAAGGFAMAPRGVPHAFLVTSPTARVLTLLTPGSAEDFYRGASEPAQAGGGASGPVDFDRVRASAERSGGMQIVGPPPFALRSPGRNY